MGADHRRLAKRADELVVDMVDLDRGEAEPREAGRGSGVAHEAREVVPGGAIAIAAEVDAREDNLTVSLVDSAVDLGEHGRGRPAARGTAHERDHAERAGERAAVLDLDERADPVEARVGLDAADR